jgi:hypothetical protein
VSPDDVKILAFVALCYTIPGHTGFDFWQNSELLEVLAWKWRRSLNTHDIKAQLLKGMSDAF